MRISDWSSDVCSSDLAVAGARGGGRNPDAGGRNALHRGSDRRARRNPAPVEQYDARRTAGQPARGRDRPAAIGAAQDRKSVVLGNSFSVRVDLGGRRFFNKQTILYLLSFFFFF